MKNSPLDFLSENRTGLVKFARIYSNVISPPIMFAVLGIAFGIKERPFLNGFLWATIYGVTVSLAPLLVVFYMLHKGYIKELHMSNTRERRLPYVASILFASLAIIILTRFNGPGLLRCLAIFNVIELSLLALINIYWLISLHSTGIMASFILTGLVWNWEVAFLVVLPFVITVCLVRLYLKRHTRNQVLAGLALGAFSVYCLTFFGCF